MASGGVKEGGQKEGEQKCTYAQCARPNQSIQFIPIDKNTTAGGQDWSSIAGEVLCRSCYLRFMKRGTLERGGHQRLPLVEGKCSNTQCVRPNCSIRFFEVEEGTKVGGQDWGHLAGRVLCHTCYYRYKSTGKLERGEDEPIAASERRCSYAGCTRPDQSRQFIQIDSGTNAGGQDWSSLGGQVLCNACYLRFLRRGSLDKSKAESLAEADRRCTYTHCVKPTESTKYTHIEASTKAGGKDWSSLVGNVLCRSCYTRYLTRGTLERSPQAVLAVKDQATADVLKRLAATRATDKAPKKIQPGK